MPRLKLPHVSTRDLLAIGLPLLAVLALSFWVAGRFVKPAPPDRFVMSTGSPVGAYHAAAEQYQRILARHGITLELRPSSGGGENLARLRDPAGDVEAAFVQGGLGRASDEDEVTLASLGSTHHEPVWIFYRTRKPGAPPIDRLGELRGRRIAIGPEGSGVRALALQLLAANDVDATNATLLPLAAEAAAEPFLRGEIDVLIHVSAPTTGIVRALLFADGVRLLSFTRGPAYTRLFPFLGTVTLPHGSINLVRDIPPEDTQLIATNAFVIVRDTLHPALQGLLLQAMKEVHSTAGPLARVNEFPVVKESGFPLADEAERFYRAGPPFLQRYLPFWAATLVDRLLVLLLPIFAVAVPLLRIAPPLYTWRIRSKIARWYGELKFLEHEIREQYDTAQLPSYVKRLDDLEAKAYSRPIPLAFTDQVYMLRMHIRMVRDLLDRRAAGEALPEDRLASVPAATGG